MQILHHNYIQKMTRARYGDAFFCTEEYQANKKNNNQFVMLKQKIERSNKKYLEMCYGYIQQMYLVRVRVYNDSAEEIVLDCHWYTNTKTPSRSGLVQVSYHEDWKVHSFVFLDLCKPENFLLLPANPFEFDFSDPSQWTNTSNTFQVIRDL